MPRSDDGGHIEDGTNLAAYAYGYDFNHQAGQNTMLGQRTSQTATVPAQGLSNALSKYSYDPLYQLTRADYPAGSPFNGEVHQWTYDAIGNRLTNTVNASTQTYTYLKNGSNPLNGQRLSSDGVNAYTWDTNGSNLTRNGTPGNFTFGYDPDNRLTSITGAATAAYTYDYQGRRTSKTVGGLTTTYFYDGLNLVGETSGATVASYLFGPGIDEPLAQYRAGSLSYFNADALGTIPVTNDTAGNATLSTSLDAWGVTRNETGTRLHPFTYTGREVGEAGLLFYRARFLLTGTGRFSQEDPAGVMHPGVATLYAYVASSPINYRDPLGLVKWKCTYGTATPSTPVLGVAGVFAGFTCSSECACGKSVFTQVAAFAFGLSAARFPIGFTFGSIELEDPKPCPDARSLEGKFGIASAGGYLIYGGGCSHFILGSAQGKSCSGGWGLDFGVTVAGGASMIVFDTTDKCCPK